MRRGPGGTAPISFGSLTEVCPRQFARTHALQDRRESVGCRPVRVAIALGDLLRWCRPKIRNKSQARSRYFEILCAGSAIRRRVPPPSAPIQMRQTEERRAEERSALRGRQTERGQPCFETSYALPMWRAVPHEGRNGP